MKNVRVIKKLFVILLLVHTVAFISGCGNNEDSDNNSSSSINKKAVYQDVDEIEGSLNDTGDLSAAWQKGGPIRSEVKVFMDTVLWAVDYDSVSTSTETDLDDDGEEDTVSIENDSETNTLGAFIKMNGKMVDLFNHVSKEFLKTMALLIDENNYFVYGTCIQLVCIDLDDDDQKEILLAVGNDNGVLAVSLFRYVGGKNLFKEVAGIKGTKFLRYIIITRDNTLFAELYFTNPATFDPLPMNYVEYAYKRETLKPTRYRLIMN